MKYKCIIFDCDGVLVDSELITSKVFVTMVNSLGVSIDMEFVHQNFLGKSFNDISRYLEIHFDKKLPAGFESNYRDKTFEAFTEELKPVDGVHELLKKLEIPYCVASSGPPEKIRHNLALTGLADKFEGKMFSCYEINSWKPNPDIFLYAAKKMGYEPADCVVIEDSRIGVEAAKRGGFDVCMYAKEKATDHGSLKGVTVFDNMAELDLLLSP